MKLPFILIGLWAVTVNSNIVSIDYGTEWFKVGVVKPGTPFDLALNSESKRKTDALVAFKGDERTFESSAKNVATRFPSTSFGNLKSLIAREFNDDIVRTYQKHWPNKMVAHPKGTSAFKLQLQGKEETLSLEELVAMQLQYAKKITEDFTGVSFKDMVFTVPAYYTHEERLAVKDAATLAGWNVKCLLNEGTATAINFATSRKFTEEPETHIFFDVGAGKTVATVATFQNVQVLVKRRNETFTQISIDGVGYNRTLGAQQLDFKLQELFAENFQTKVGKKNGINVFESPRAMAKLFREANRVKHILSANQETTAMVESLIDDFDFRYTMKREEFEALSNWFVQSIRKPIMDAISAAKLKQENIKSIITMGGGTRIPMVQEELKKIMGEDKLAFNVNNDEAIALGSAFYSARFNSRFRVKEFIIKDSTPLPVDVIFTSSSKDSQDAPREQIVRLFHESGKLDVKKSMKFKKTEDFTFRIAYGVEREDPKSFGPNSLFNVKIEGLTKALAEAKNVDMDSVRVRVLIQLDKSGFIQVKEASATYTILPEKGKGMMDSFMDLFRKKGQEDSVDDVSNAKQDEENEDDDLSSHGDDNPTKAKENSTSSDEKNLEKNKNKDEKSEKTTEDNEKPKEENVSLIVTVEAIGIKSFTEEQVKEVKERMKRFDDVEKKRKAHSEARNELESFVYKAKDYANTEAVKKVATKEMLENFISKLDENGDWLYGEGESADITAFKNRLHELQAIYNPIDLRKQEEETRPPAIKTLNSYIANVTKLIEGLTSNYTRELEEDLYEELDASTKLVKSTKAWLEEKLKKQTTTPSYETPVLLTKDLLSKSSELKYKISVLEMKKRFIDMRIETERLKKAAEEKSKSEAAKKAKETTTKEEDQTTEATSTESGDGDSETSTIEMKPTKTESATTTSKEEGPKKHMEL